MGASHLSKVQKICNCSIKRGFCQVWGICVSLIWGVVFCYIIEDVVFLLAVVLRILRRSHLGIYGILGLGVFRKFLFFKVSYDLN